MRHRTQRQWVVISQSYGASEKQRLETVWRLEKFERSDSTGSISDSPYTRFNSTLSRLEKKFQNRLSSGILSDSLLVEPSDVHKTEVTTPFGLFNFTRTPFGLGNSSQNCQRFIYHVTRGLDFVFVYLDDLLVTSPDHRTHKKHLRILLDLFIPHYNKQKYNLFNM